MSQNTSSQSMLWGHAIVFWDSWGFWLMLAGAAIGALALLVTLASSIILYRVAGAAQTELTAKTTALSGELGTQKAQAVKDTKALELQIAQANERAAASVAVAEEAKLELAQYKAPRSLSEGQQARLTDLLKPYAGQSFDIETQGDAGELMKLKAQLLAVFSKVGWAQAYTEGQIYFLPAVSGVRVNVMAADGAKTREAAETLAKALSAFHIVTEFKVDSRATTATDKILVQIGLKQ